MKKYDYKKTEVILKNKVTPAVLAALAIVILTYVLYYLGFDLQYGIGSSAILFASFGSSAFVLFLMPRSKAAAIDAFVKSYLLAAALGLVGFYMLGILPLYLVSGIILLALALMMYMSSAEHPPAVGIAMAFILYKIDIYGVLVVALGVVVLIFLRFVLERFVYILEKDLIKDVETR